MRQGHATLPFLKIDMRLRGSPIKGLKGRCKVAEMLYRVCGVDSSGRFPFTGLVLGDISSDKQLSLKTFVNATTLLGCI